MNLIKNKMEIKLKEIKEQCEKNYISLKEDNRDDEAKIEKIRSNIADIFISVLNVSYEQSKSKGKDDSSRCNAMIEMYLGFFDKIPANWKASLSKAEENDDFETIYIEKEKIAMADKIKKIFMEIAEVKNV